MASSAYDHLEAAEALMKQVREGIDFQAQHGLAVTSRDVTFYDTRLRMAELHVRIYKELRG